MNSPIGKTEIRIENLRNSRPHNTNCIFCSVKGSNLIQQTVVTCLDTLNKSFDEPDSISCLVIGSESGKIFILDPTATSIIKDIQLKDVPVFISVSGKYDVEYRIIVACRDGKLYTIKNGEVTGTVIELESPPVRSLCV